MHTPWAGANRFYGPPLLVKLEYVPPELLYSPQDKERSYEASCSPPDWGGQPSYGWLDTPYDASVRPYLIGFSYTFRRWGEPDIAYGGTQSVNPSTSGYVTPFKRDRTKSFLSCRFLLSNYVSSFHGGDSSLAIGPIYGNGQGWHVGYVDGFVSFQHNDPEIYRYEYDYYDAAGGWTNQHWNWFYWDINP